MAYKPLNLETVAHHYRPLKNARTTEQNIANQQRIDLASVEDFISRQRLNLMNIGVTEEPARKKVVASSKAVRNAYQSETPVQKRAGRNQIGVVKFSNSSRSQKSSIQKSESQESVNSLSPILKRKPVDEHRQIHKGLAQMEQYMKF